MPGVIFSHPNIGTLTIDNGIDDAQWGYNLNTAVFPTYGGEVVQILSVYIDDLIVSGTCATYSQMEAIYRFFAHYLQIASQGKNQIPNIGTSVKGTAYNLVPVSFRYPHRNWAFNVMPKAAPGFRYGLDVVTPEWKVTCHVVDDTPDLDLIKNGIKAAVKDLNADQRGFISINGEISPDSGDPDKDPFKTYQGDQAQQQQVIKQYSTYYNNLLSAYGSGDFSSLVGATGSQPNFGNNNNNKHPNTTKVPKPPDKTKSTGGFTFHF